MLDTKVQFIGAKEALTTLKQVQPDVYKQLVKDIKSIVSDAVSEIKKVVPTVSPLTHANHSGRTSYQPVKVTPRVTPSARASFGNKARLVQIETKSVGKYIGFELIDMAGRGGWLQRQSKTRTYAYKGTTRSHKINGQQAGMKKKLGSGKGSRFVYPAAEAMIPAMSVEVAQAIDTATAKINRKLNRL